MNPYLRFILLPIMAIAAYFKSLDFSQNFNPIKKMVLLGLCYLFFSPVFSFGQLASNQDNINYQAILKRCWAGGQGDEPTFLFKAAEDSDEMTTFLMPNPPIYDHPAGEDFNYHWDAVTPAWSTDILNNNIIITKFNKSGPAQKFDFHARYFENNCGSRTLYEEDCNIFFQDDQHILGGTELIDPKIGNGAEWKQQELRGCNAISSEVEICLGKVEYQTVWRYTKGDKINESLQFGTISSGTKTHSNTNRSAPSGANSQMGYTNTRAESSPDVFYSFKLSSAKRVTISTNYNETNFDTYIHLLDSDGATLESNDNDGNSTKSKIIRNLCAGDYHIIVEGNEIATGDFRLSIYLGSIFFDAGTTWTTPTSVCFGADLPIIHEENPAVSTLDISYKWESSIDNGQNWIDVDETTKILSNPGKMPKDNIKFLRIASVCNSSVSEYSSNIITFTEKESEQIPGLIALVGTNKIPPNTDPGIINSDTSTWRGLNYPLDARATPTPDTLIWQQKVGTSALWKIIDGANEQSYDIPALAETTTFRRGVYSSCGETPTNFSNEIKVTVFPNDGKIEGYIRSTLGDVNTGINGISVKVEQLVVLPGSPIGTTYETTTQTINGLTGGYSFDNIYYGPNGANFKIIPIRVGHKFSPEDTTLTLSNANHDKNVDFQDISTFEITGRVTQDLGGVLCSLEGITIELIQNGLPTGNPTTTLADGTYTLTTIAGNYSIRATAIGYTFSPTSTGIINIIDNENNVNFSETTTYQVQGHVLAGCNRYIGGTVIRFSDKSNCNFVETNTDENGFYQIDLPARLYNVEVVTYTPDPETGYNKDVVENFFKTTTLDLTTDDQTLNFTYHSPPVIEVTGMPAIPCINYPYSVLAQTKLYDLRIKIFEEGSTCPISAGMMTINDQISDLGAEPITLAFNESNISYTLKPGNPNIVFPYLKSITIAVKDTFEQSAVDNKNLSALVTGARPRGQTFSTQSPEIPLLILRDPPGDASYSFWEENNTSETAFRVFTQDAEVNNSWTNARLGVAYDLGVSGFGVSISTQTAFWDDEMNSRQIAETSSNINEKILSITNSQSFQTSTELTGRDGDIFYGVALAFAYSIADEILFDETNCEPVTSKSLVMATEGLETTYSYTEVFIREVEIPRLQSLKNSSSDNAQRANYDNQISVWQQLLQRNEDLKADAVGDKLHQFSGLVSLTESTTNTTTASSTFEFSMEIDREVAKEMGLESAGNGASGGTITNFKVETGESRDTVMINSVTTGYHLEDSNQNDNFTVKVKTDPVYKTPVFELLGGESSCPFEGAPSAARDAPQLRVENPIAIGINPNEVAAFVFYVGNVSATGETRDNYLLRLNQSSNSGGATIKIGGSNFGAPIDLGPIPFESEQTQIITVERGTSPFYSFESLEFELYSDCDPTISSKVALSVFFQSPCSDISLSVPLESELVNLQDNEEVKIRLTDYDINDLDQITIQYALTGSNSWSTGLIIPSNELVDAPSGTEVTWPVINLPDGIYQVRLALKCGINTILSNREEIRINRKVPALFGLPQPIDDNYQTGDEISITFDQTLDCSTFNTTSLTLKRLYFDEFIPAQLTCFGNKITITSSVDLTTYNGEPLEISLKDVTSEFGNTESQPFVWQFTVGGDLTTLDFDEDGVINPIDKCEGFDDSIDKDNDGIPDACDLCPNSANPSLNFDGVDDYVQVDNLNGFATGNTSHTIEGWIYIDELSPNKNNWALVLGQRTNGSHHWFFGPSGNSQIGVWGGPQLGPQFQVGKWTHLATVFDGTKLILYINGVKFGERTAQFNFANSQLDLGLRNGAHANFNGKMDNFRIWNTPRTQSEINQFMDKEINENSPGLILNYTLNEGIINGDNTGLTNVQDQSGMTNNGTLNGFTKTGTASNWVHGAIIETPDANNNGIGDLCEVTTTYDCTQEELQLGAQKYTSGTYSAITTLISESTIEANNEVIFTAGQAITLKPGFHAQSNAAFTAIIADCSPPALLRTTEAIISKPLPPKVDLTLKLFPNPAKLETNIQFNMPEKGKAYLQIYNGTGGLIQELLSDQVLEEGAHIQSLNTSSLQNGMYFIVLRTKSGSLTTKLIVLD